MAEYKTKTLFSAVVKVLLLAALIPVFIFGLYMMETDSRLIKAEIIEKQSFLNGAVGSSVRAYLGRKRGMLRAFLALHGVFSSGKTIAKSDLKDIKAIYPEIVAIGYIDSAGAAKAADGDLALSTGRSGELNAIKYLCITKGEEYIGVIRNEGSLSTMIVAVPDIQNGKVRGALAAKFNIAEMISGITESFAEGVFYAVFSGDDRLITASSEITEDVKEVLRETAGRKSGEFKFKDGRNYIVTTSVISATGWTVYVQQPSQAWTELFLKNYPMLGIVGLMLACVMIFVLLLSKVVIRPVIEPMKKLETAAEQLSMGRFNSLPRPEDMPANEVGDLGRSFIAMAASLKQQSDAITKAKEELADENAVLEKKVEERTRELSHATDALVKKERLAAIGEMASIISHEIRNPLAVISNSTRLIQALSVKDNAKLNKQFNIIESEVKQANRIVEEVLGYARDRKQILSTVAVNDYVKDILAVQPVPQNIKITQTWDEKNPEIIIDLEEVKQAVVNLMNNALEVMPSGGTLHVGTRTGKKVVCVYLCDEGTGMGEETLMKIFTPFFTTKARGTGLGLAVVKKAVANNKGKIFVESVKGKGTKFKVFFKIAKRKTDGKTS